MSRETIVAITDGGGRGAALVEAYSRSPHVDRILAFPGNDLMRLSSFGVPVECFSTLTTTSKREILEICADRHVTLLDVCQDNAVAAGLVDDALAVNLPVVGPTRLAGKIEWDKIYARRLGELMLIDQPRFMAWDDQDDAIDHYAQLPNEEPLFVKAAGLAEGKGAIPARNRQELVSAIRGMSRFGQVGREFLVEEWLRNDDGTPGEEFSYLVLCQGEDFVYLGSTEDNKPIGNRGEGKNTGSMGGHNEPMSLEGGMRAKVERDAIKPITRGLILDQRPFRGVFYYSGMKVHQAGVYRPYMVECNARLGDPEAQIILPGIKNDWFEISMMLARGESIKNLKIENDELRRVCVTVASLGYPDDYSQVKGKKIFGIEEVQRMDNVRLYGAGVKYDKNDNTYRVGGGRLVYIVGEGSNLISARERAYAGASHIIVDGYSQTMRDDIAAKEIEKLHR